MKTKEKTIKEAIAFLPLNCQEVFTEIFKNTKAMDLYNGDLLSYLRVINQTLNNQAYTIANLKKRINEAIHVLK